MTARFWYMKRNRSENARSQTAPTREVQVKHKIAFVAVCAFGACSILAQAQAPPPADRAPVFWSAAQMKEIDQKLAAQVDPQLNMAGARLLSSANAIYRTGPSQSEAHEKQADFIVVRSGEGTILVGGRIVGGKLARANEIRGDSIEGATPYKVGPGDSLFIPVNVAHQFVVEKGKHLALTLIKIDAQP
jgi:mannose-6-phosphate isomerase-like protein (cupin superfamily)